MLSTDCETRKSIYMLPYKKESALWNPDTAVYYTLKSCMAVTLNGQKGVKMPRPQSRIFRGRGN